MSPLELVKGEKWHDFHSSCGDWGRARRCGCEVFVADMVFGSIDEIGPDCVVTVGLGGSITSSMGAYLITRGCCLKKTVKYELERINTGWKVAMVVFPTMKAPKP